MPRYVKIASLPARPLVVPDTSDFEACTRAELAYWETLLARVAPDKPDLILTPECCDRPAGLSREQRPGYYAVRGNRVRDFFMDEAAKLNTNIAYSAVISCPDGTYRNAIQLIDRQGRVTDAYHKNMLVIEEHTKSKIKYGRDCHAMQSDIGRICGAVCFDLNFEETLKRVKAEHPDITLFPSNYHGGLMQAYWAYQTRSYFVSCIGLNGTAAVINPVGRTVAESSNYYEYVTANINLDCAVAHLDYNMKRFGLMKQKYGSGVTMDTPYGLGVTLLTNNVPGMTIHDIIREFGIELWDDYYARALKAREEPGAIED